MGAHLYLIGNGFDIHHGINSKYSDFREWLGKVNSDLICQINELYGIEDNDAKWWSDFENKLASLDAVNYGAQIAQENVPDLLSEHCDAMWNQASIEVELQLDRLFSELRGYFHDWVIHLNSPSFEKMINLNTQDSIFINFNYTKTLEILYGVNALKVLHVHGCIDSDENFILGHGCDSNKLWKMNKIEMPKFPQNIPLDEINEYYESFFGYSLHEKFALEASIRGIVSQKKPVKEIIRKYSKKFDSIKNVKVVHVYGISLSKVDMPYFIYFAKKFNNTLWEFSDYNSSF